MKWTHTFARHENDPPGVGYDAYKSGDYFIARYPGSRFFWLFKTGESGLGRYKSLAKAKTKAKEYEEG